LAFKREDEGGAAFIRDGAGSGVASASNFGKPRRREVPGADPEYLPPGAAPGGGVPLPGSEQEKLSKSAAKNKKKREAKKKEADDAAAAAAAAAAQKNGNRGVNANGASKGGKPNGTAKATEQPAEPAPVEEPGAQDKKIRGLLKKMRAIDELKMRLAGGEKLEDTQMKKIQTEEGVRKELEGLGYNG